MSVSTESSPSVDKRISYLRGRVAQVFDQGSQGTPRWSMTDAHAVRAVLDELRKLRGKR